MTFVSARDRRREQAFQTEGLDPAVALREQLRRLRGESEHVAFLDWAVRIPEPKTGTLDFRRFPFQPEMYETMAGHYRQVVVRKATQVGVSSMTVRWGLYEADRNGRTILYVFPTKGDVHDFCLARGELVLMADGTTKPVEDVRPGDRVWSSDGEVVVPDTVTRVCAPGRKRVLRVEMTGGRRVRATGDHRVWTRAGWRRVADLREGDEVAVPSRLPEPEGQEYVPLDDAFLLALWLAEGTKVAAGFTFTNGMPEIRERAAAIAGAREWTFAPGDRHSVRLTANTRRDDGSPAGLLRRYGVRGMATETIRVPDAIMRAPRPVVEEFLGTYIACDGWVGPRETTVASASERMIRDLQLLCARLGIAATVRAFQPHSYAPGRKRKAGKRSWMLGIAQHESRERLARIGVPGKLPRREATLSAEDVALRSYVEAGGEDERVFEALRLRSAPALRWGRVRRIVQDGQEDTFDLETREHHAFFVEGALTHNSDARVQPMFDESDYLFERAGEPFNKGLKRVGVGLVYFRGSENKRGLDSVDADGLALDEYDTLNQANIPDAERRLSGPLSAGLIRRVGVPSLPQFGIAERYDESDKRKWLVRCEACNHRGLDAESQEPLVAPRGTGWQEIDFWKNVDQKLRTIVCAGCGERLDVGRGVWVAQQAESAMPGFHVSKLMVPGIDRQALDGTSQLDTIIRAARRGSAYETEVFYNKDLGLPYVSKEARLSLEEIASCIREYGQVPGYVGDNDVTMGVDVATVRQLNVRISEHVAADTKRALFIGTVDDFDELALLMDRFQVKMAAIDHLPEGRLARAFQQKFPGRVFIVNYATEGQHDVLKVDVEQARASLRRTEAFDATVERVRRQRNVLPLDVPEGYAAHMTANVRRVEEDQLGRKRVVWVNTRPDDYFQAEVYDEAALALWLIRQQVEGAQQEVYTRLEDHLEFRRGEVDQLGNAEWRPGPGDGDDFGHGFYES